MIQEYDVENPTTNLILKTCGTVLGTPVFFWLPKEETSRLRLTTFVRLEVRY